MLAVKLFKYKKFFCHFENPNSRIFSTTYTDANKTTAKTRFEFE